jgi:Fe-S-cluster containining protein
VSPRRQSGYYRLIDLSKIPQLSHERDEENWEFRSWLKQYAPDDIDVLVKSLSRKYFTLIDCTSCENCCRSLHVEFKKSELHVIAKTLGHSIETFQNKYMSEGSVNPPCPMLNGKLCSIYENRPDVCRSFPHLEQPEFTSRLIGVIDSVAICPIAFSAFEELEAEISPLTARLYRSSPIHAEALRRRIQCELLDEIFSCA